MMIIYVLKLEDEKYYIGKTAHLARRNTEHFTGNGSRWTLKYKPLYLLETIENTEYFTELGVTLYYMYKYGIENVRGSVYSSVDLSDKEKNEIVKHIRGELNLCFNCGDRTHFSENCTKKNIIKKFLAKFKLGCCKKNIISFGKYKGCSYTYVYKNDKEYCSWIRSQQSNNEQFNDFKKWLLE